MKKKYSQENETCKYQSVKESREKYEQKLEPLAKKISEMSGINLDECRRKKKPISILTLLKKTEMFKRLIDYNKAIAYLVISEYSSHRIGVQETREAGLYSIDGSFSVTRRILAYCSIDEITDLLSGKKKHIELRKLALERKRCQRVEKKQKSQQIGAENVENDDKLCGQNKNAPHGSITIARSALTAAIDALSSFAKKCTKCKTDNVCDANYCSNCGSQTFNG